VGFASFYWGGRMEERGEKRMKRGEQRGTQAGRGRDEGYSTCELFL